MVIEDFVMLGKTIPEPQKDGRIFVCSAGVSTELNSLTRIYPLARRQCPKRWTLSSVQVERNPKDSRPESFKLKGHRHGDCHEQINGECFDNFGQLNRSERLQVIDHYYVSSIKEANHRRLSLAVVQPSHIPQLSFDHNDQSPDSPQFKLFTDDLTPQEGAKRFAFIPRLTFDDEDGGHCLMLRDWGCFEFMRKRGNDRRYHLHGALGLNNNPPLLVGNMNRRRNAWLVISVLTGLEKPVDDLFGDLQ